MDIQKTDFIGAMRANQRRSRRLVLLLMLLMVTLGFVLGFGLDYFLRYSLYQYQYQYLDYSQYLRYLIDPAFWRNPQNYRFAILGALTTGAVGLIWSAYAVLFGDRLVLSMVEGEVAAVSDYPVLHNVVEEMSIAAGMPKPQMYVIPTDALNAFATGLKPEKSSIAVTQGLLDTLTREELQGVIGHEMGHIVNGDMRYQTIVAVLVGLVAYLSQAAIRGLIYGRSGSREGRNPWSLVLMIIMVLLFAVLAPLAARFVQMAVSRQREFLADATSVQLTRDPTGLILALQKLSDSSIPFRHANKGMQHLFIVNPFQTPFKAYTAWFSTHPPLDQRIEQLKHLTD
jgi:heat shock protein HtpX